MLMDDARQLADRADLARLLAASYYQPDAEFAEQGLFAQLVRAAKGVDPRLAHQAQKVADAFAADDLQTLLVDYARLFLGPPKALAQPYGSVWLTQAQALMQDTTMAVWNLYREGGFTIADEFRDLPDHISAELEFLYLLLFKSAQAEHTRDEGSVASVSALRRRFLDQHLGHWVEPFAAAVTASAQSPYYRELADLTSRFVVLERDVRP